MDQQKRTNENKKMTSKQIVAIIGIILLVALYLITLLAAIFDSSASHSLFMGSLLASIFIPMMIWIYTWLYGKMTGKKTIASSEFKINSFEEVSDKRKN